MWPNTCSAQDRPPTTRTTPFKMAVVPMLRTPTLESIEVYRKCFSYNNISSIFQGYFQSFNILLVCDSKHVLTPVNPGAGWLRSGLGLDWIPSHRFLTVNLEVDFLTNGLKNSFENSVLIPPVQLISQTISFLICKISDSDHVNNRVLSTFGH